MNIGKKSNLRLKQKMSGVFIKMLDTLQQRQVQKLYVVSILGSGYVEFGILITGLYFHIWIQWSGGIVASGGRTLDLTLAYSSLHGVCFDDDKFKYGLSENGWLIRKPNHFVWRK
jgi:hypothetical protein